MALETTVMWTVCVGVGAAVDVVVVILLQLLLQSVRALDRRVDYVWSAAAGVHALTSTVGPQLQTAQRHVAALGSAANPSPPAPAQTWTPGGQTWMPAGLWRNQ